MIELFIAMSVFMIVACVLFVSSLILICVDDYTMKELQPELDARQRVWAVLLTLAGVCLCVYLFMGLNERFEAEREAEQTSVEATVDFVGENEVEQWEQ